MLAALSSQEIEHMLLNRKGGSVSKWRDRALKPELLDAAGPECADRNLRELARINRWFGGHRALLRVMRDLVHPQEHFTVLDVGAGSGDMGRCLARHFRKVRVVSLDRRPMHLRDAPSPRVVADALQLPFARHTFDFVLCSSVLHHFPDSGVVDIISTLRLFARRALLLLDLERHPLAYHFLPMTRKLFGWGPLTVHDGPISVAAAFRLEELVSLTQAAGSSVAIGRRHRPWFRLSVVVPACSSESAGSERDGSAKNDSYSVLLGSVGD
jgi:2-polyprenyl-3-methyl-5-hydroxy-6-metoxy-1,4-benzoquinol methylase